MEYRVPHRIIGSVFGILTLMVLMVGISPGYGNPVGVDDWEEVFDTARAVLAKMPDPGRLDAAIKDEALRKAMRRAYDALKACAKVHRSQNRATKEGTLAEFERSFNALQTEAEHSEYQDCAKKCKADIDTCEKDCASARKKFCGCRMTQLGCFARTCVVG